MPPEPERDLAAFAAELETEAIPDRVRDRAGLTIADTLGAIVAGSTDDAVVALARRWTDGVSGGATVLGADGGETVPPLAALCNGAAGTVLELDEGHRFAAGHPAIHVLPALLADAEIGYGDSDAFVRSFVAGYEVAVRTARAVGTLESGGTTRTACGGGRRRGRSGTLSRTRPGDDALGHGHRGELRATHPVRGGDGGRDRAERLRRHEQPRGAGRRRSGGSRVRRRRTASRGTSNPPPTGSTRQPSRRDSASAGSWNTATSRSTPRVGTPTRRWMPSRPSRTGWMRPRWSRSASRRIRRPHG